MRKKIKIKCIPTEEFLTEVEGKGLKCRGERGGILLQEGLKDKIIVGEGFSYRMGGVRIDSSVFLRVLRKTNNKVRFLLNN